ncbi:MAG: hypothetical protein IIB63_03260 [Proteobacteria bacterium]|nr:hypothetical protein [Pseudomonadota bacterium]
MVVIIDPPSGLPIPRRTDRAPRNKRRGRVPRPEDIRQVTAETLRDPGLHATPEDFGAGIARAVEDLGMKAAGITLAFDEKRRQAEDDTAGIAGLADARMRFNKVARSMEAQADKADGFTANLGPALAAETDAILRDLRGLRHSQRAEDAIRNQLRLLATRMVARGAKFEHGARLSQLGIEVDAAVRNLALAAFNSPGDWPAIMEETEARLARFKDKLPPDILAAKVAAARGMIAANAAAGLIELDPALARQELKAGLFDDDLPAAERKRLRARAKAAVRDRRAQAELGQIENRATAAADGARRLVALEGAIGRGEAGEQAIAEAADILDDPTRARLHERLDAGRADDAARNRRIEKVSAVLAGRAPATGEGDGKPDGGGVKDGDLRPGAPEWPQAVDDHYASLSDTLETMDPDERARFEDDYARATGVLPGAVAKRLRGGLLSADPAEQAAAATHLVRLKDVDPALFSVIPAVERRRAQAIAGFVDLGLPPPRAVELAQKKRAQLVLPTEDLTGGAGSRTLIGDVRVGSEEEIPVTSPGGKGSGDDGSLASDAKGEEDQSPPQRVNTAGAKPQKASTDKRKESLDKVERTYRGYVELGRDLGLDFAADNLERFLNGTRGTKNITRDEARQFDAIKEAEDTNRTRFEESFLDEGPGPEDTFLEMEDIGSSSKPQHTFNAQLKRIKDGAPPINLGTDYWEREFHFLDQLIQLVTGEADFALGVGRTELISEGTFTAERKGNVIHVKGTVDHVWEDKYKFKRNQPFADGALALQKHRGARPFDILAEWKQKVQGTIEIVDGALKNPKFQWTDVK